MVASSVFVVSNSLRLSRFSEPATLRESITNGQKPAAPTSELELQLAS
jgi:hypothetical protein